MLASDPHLPYMLPVGLYQVHLSGAGYDVAGSGYPGRRASGSATTTAIAWGITNLVASPRDLYVETLDSDDAIAARASTATATTGRRSRRAPRRSPCAARPTRRITVRSTARGPLVDEIVPLAPEPGPNGEPTALSVRWTGQEVLHDIQAVLDLNRAQ